jgi:ABC-type sugar transport system substrate-binding protein
MFTKTKTALSVAIVLGALGTASAALAGDQTDERGGYVLPGSTDGVNPVYHPGIFGNADAAKAYGFVASPRRKHRTNAPKAVR